MLKIRDYKAEYARRIARGLSAGLSRSQSRGHPRPGEAYRAIVKPINAYDKQLEDALKQIRKGKSLKEASKSVGVSAERVRTYIVGQGVAEKVKGRWTIGEDLRTREIGFASRGRVVISTVTYETSQIIGSYCSAVGQFLNTHAIGVLTPFVNKSVSDIHGIKYPFETDPNTLYRLSNSGDLTFEHLYKMTQI